MAATKLLLLFIHGLGGSASSWGSFEELILADSELSSRVDVRFFAYPTGFVRYWLGPKYLDLQSLADGLGSALAVEYDKYEKIMLVCHSMGGLVAKRYIADRRVLYDKHADFAAATRAIETADSHALEQLIASKGRSWIETRHSDQATDLLNRVVEKFNADSAEVVWSKYLLIISRLFRTRDTSSTAIDEGLIATSEQLRLAPLLLAEKMELARKRNDKNETIALYSRVTKQLANRTTPRAAGEAYAIGTSHFLVGNLLRFGGLYSNAKASIETARAFFRPAIMSHQIELAHCQYAIEVCKAVMGETSGENAIPTGSGEFRPFAEALLTLVRSHSEWSKGRIPSQSSNGRP